MQRDRTLTVVMGVWDLSSTEPAIAVISRNNPNEQESVQVYKLD